MTTQEKAKVRLYLKGIGMDVFVNIIYPALKKSLDIDSNDVCRMYPEYEKRVKSDKSKRTRLSKAKSIIRNGWVEYALTIISESTRVEEQIVNKSKKCLEQIK